jgi:hypothetical protein
MKLGKKKAAAKSAEGAPVATAEAPPATPAKTPKAKKEKAPTPPRKYKGDPIEGTLAYAKEGFFFWLIDAPNVGQVQAGLIKKWGQDGIDACSKIWFTEGANGHAWAHISKRALKAVPRLRQKAAAEEASEKAAHARKLEKAEQKRQAEAAAKAKKLEAKTAKTEPVATAAE